MAVSPRARVGPLKSLLLLLLGESCFALNWFARDATPKRDGNVLAGREIIQLSVWHFLACLSRAWAQPLSVAVYVCVNKFAYFCPVRLSSVAWSGTHRRAHKNRPGQVSPNGEMAIDLSASGRCAPLLSIASCSQFVAAKSRAPLLQQANSWTSVDAHSAPPDIWPPVITLPAVCSVRHEELTTKSSLREALEKI